MDDKISPEQNSFTEMQGQRKAAYFKIDKGIPLPRANQN